MVRMHLACELLHFSNSFLTSPSLCRVELRPPFLRSGNDIFPAPRTQLPLFGFNGRLPLISVRPRHGTPTFRGLASNAVTNVSAKTPPSGWRERDGRHRASVPGTESSHKFT